MNFEITSGKVSGKGLKAVVYGSEGIGKTSLAARFPNPVFIDTEGSTDNMNVRRLPKPTSWEMLKQETDFVKNGGASCSTIVIDTFDWAEQLCINNLCEKNQKRGIEDFGWGNGYVYEKEEIARFLTQLEEVTLRGINVVINCHAATRKYELPEEIGRYDRWELKLGQKTGSQISPIVKEWADMVLFLNYKTHVFAADDKGTRHKAAGRKRVIYTSHHPCWDAKNRFGLPEELPLSWESIAAVIPDNFKAPEVQQNTAPVNVPTAQQIVEKAENMGIPIDFSGYEEILPAYERVQGIPEALADLMEADYVTAEEIEKVCSEVKGYMPKGMPMQNYPADFVQGCLIGAWNQVHECVKSLRTENAPF